MHAVTSNGLVSRGSCFSVNGQVRLVLNQQKLQQKDVLIDDS